MSGVSDEAVAIRPPLDGEKTAGRRLRLLSYNVQVGIASVRPHHYLTRSWRHFLPDAQRFETLDRIARVLSEYDVVALQELDAGSHRTGYVDLTAYLAERAGFPFWYHQLNRDLGPIAQHGNGLLARMRPTLVEEHRLPGLIPGRGGLMALFGSEANPLVVLLIHLALGRRARHRQIDYICEVVNNHDHVIVMGDMNTDPASPEMARLFRNTTLREPTEVLHTFPSWRPNRSIDHILVSPAIRVSQCHVLQHNFSDHLPIAMEVELPSEIALPVTL